MTDPTAGICGHRCPAHPDWHPCQLPPGHSTVIGHRDSTGDDLQHVWQDHGHDNAPAGSDAQIMLNAAAEAFETQWAREAADREGT